MVGIIVMQKGKTVVDELVLHLLRNPINWLDSDYQANKQLKRTIAVFQVKPPLF
ncbi:MULTISPECIES: hypothetical protein [Desertifilum]|uniref:hypothetical protein n=1 Tax=Desertifilum TaxID=1185872 RepID=UPI0013018AC8|nr:MULTISPECIES: hypothetical protein [Desertifilum]MBD2321767.1 hypothetical protein [Desertifilum sp. FACHB-866]MBD2331894.1 hypothetical protein [Desertifilum sp. FACHB-868]MCD8486218.1 hypothetical protein [Desertifilum sp.]